MKIVKSNSVAKIGDLEVGTVVGINGYTLIITGIYEKGNYVNTFDIEYLCSKTIGIDKEVEVFPNAKLVLEP